VAAGAVAGGVGIGLVRASGYHVPADVARGLQTLSPWHYVVIEAFGARVLAPEHADVADFADGFMVGLAADDSDNLLRFVAYLEHIAPLAAGHVSRFSSLSPVEQDDVLRSLEQSNIDLLRAGFQALEALSMMAYYKQPASWKAIGYDGPVVDWGKQ
jgi:hypothetical protein